ncbi:MAG: hypothetical protein SGBAC_010470 [Bacillariaceae sp.]
MEDNRGMMEGIGGPVRMNPYTLNGIDPALDACCQREVESNRKHNALQSTLKRHDRIASTEERHRRARNLVKTSTFEGCRCCYDPNSDGGGDYRALMDYKEQKRKDEVQIQQGGNTNAMLSMGEKTPSAAHERPTESETDSDDDSEFDYLLDDDDLPGASSANKQWEEARKQELEDQIWSNQVAMQHGFGVHRQLHPLRVLKVAGIVNNNNKNNNNSSNVETSNARAPPPAVVLHFFDAESLSSASLDYYIEKRLAPANIGTMFLRAPGRSTLQWNADSRSVKGTLLGQLALDRDLPCLIAIRDGVVLNVCPNLREFCHSRDGEGEIETHAVEQWLNQSGVLIDRAPPIDTLCYVRPEEDALMNYLGATANTVSSSKSADDKAEIDYYCCGLEGCQKTFYHEHVGVETSQQSGLVVKEETVLETED